ncbi:Quaternary ammonium compound-resistance protein SugE [Carnobacterium maltaromaticum]|uniref:DMT family transporter n=1 Tax=Carnobacterium maltaromaticum TaxID=2751 RepID=UPI00191B9D14|nr:multidrug efflux SMR transporter [Carnobacterium maltaromaticum]CAD5900453.1 Quaternary ammonium compound-resistance protein SugE [Carnobacterium maltaromaticum]
MSWIDLIIAGLFEVFWSTMMKLSHGFTKLNYSIYTLIGMVISFYFLAKAIKVLPMSLSYPIWTGIGALGSIIVGILLFKDQIAPITWLFIAFLLVGIIGIKVTSGQ